MPDVIDYKAQPLGSLPGEQALAVPYNYTPDRVIVRVRNLSATLPRLIVKEAVSFRRGGQEQLRDGKAKSAFGPNTSADDLRFRVLQGDNMDWTEKRIQPIDFAVRHDNKRYSIPAVDPKTGEKAPWITVDPGAWDLYMGNYERMHARDEKTRTEEMIALQGRGLNKWVVDLDDPDSRPYALLEFSREEVNIQYAEIDKDAVQSGRIIEV